jgi:hypothetical protein
MNLYSRRSKPKFLYNHPQMLHNIEPQYVSVFIPVADQPAVTITETPVEPMIETQKRNPAFQISSFTTSNKKEVEKVRPS